MSFAAYKRTLEQTETPRQIERRILARLTGRMERYCAEFDGATDHGARLALLAADLGLHLWENEQIWQSFMSDVAEPDNTLPGPLKAGILSLGHWVERHTQMVMRGAAPIAPLVDVNKNIIAGLGGDPNPVQPAEPAAEGA